MPADERGRCLERSAEHAAAGRRPFARRADHAHPLAVDPTLDRQSGQHLQSRSPQQRIFLLRTSGTTGRPSSDRRPLNRQELGRVGRCPASSGGTGKKGPHTTWTCRRTDVDAKERRSCICSIALAPPTDVTRSWRGSLVASFCQPPPQPWGVCCSVLAASADSPASDPDAAAFEVEFLEMMIGHNQMAVHMGNDMRRQCGSRRGA